MKKLFWSLAVLVSGSISALAQQPYVQTVPYITSGLSKPVEITHCKDARLFIVEQDGRIRIVRNDSLLTNPFLDINPQVLSTGTEQGLLGLAFDPDYKSNGYFFVNYINNSGNTVISRFGTNPLDSNLADPASEVVFMTVNQPYTNHNGGDIEFGPDGYLYIPLGDGGSANDPQNRAQNKKERLGKILRIDVRHGSSYLIPPDNPHVNDTTWFPEIWSLGVRNTWKASFDRLTGDLWFGDVGQDTWEEIDFVSSLNMEAKNFGWRCYEATHPFNTSGCQPLNVFTEPVYEYQHAGGNCSVTGGLIYRGAKYGNLFGHYLFADFCIPEIRSLKQLDDTTFSYLTHSTWSGAGISIFGQDRNGEMYVGNMYNGHIRRIVDTTSCAPTAFLAVDDTIRICAPNGELSTPYGDSLTFIWYRNGVMLPVTSNILTIAQNGLYVVQVQNTATGCSAGDTVFVQLTQNAPTINFSSLNNLYCVFDAPVTLSATPAGGTFSGIGVSGNTFDPSLSGAGKFLVQYTYTTSNGCIYKSTLLTEVRTCVGQFEQGNVEGLTVYPNPAHDLVQVVFNVNSAERTIFDLFDLSGRKVLSEQVNHAAGQVSHQLKTARLNPGTYLLRLTNDAGTSGTRLIIY